MNIIIFTVLVYGSIRSLIQFKDPHRRRFISPEFPPIKSMQARCFDTEVVEEVDSNAPNSLSVISRLQSYLKNEKSTFNVYIPTCGRYTPFAHFIKYMRMVEESERMATRAKEAERMATRAKEAERLSKRRRARLIPISFRLSYQLIYTAFELGECENPKSYQLRITYVKTETGRNRPVTYVKTETGRNGSELAECRADKEFQDYSERFMIYWIASCLGKICKISFCTTIVLFLRKVIRDIRYWFEDFATWRHFVVMRIFPFKLKCTSTFERILPKWTFLLTSTDKKCDSMDYEIDPERDSCRQNVRLMTALIFMEIELFFCIIYRALVNLYRYLKSLVDFEHFLMLIWKLLGILVSIVGITFYTIRIFFGYESEYEYDDFDLFYCVHKVIMTFFYVKRWLKRLIFRQKEENVHENVDSGDGSSDPGEESDGPHDPDEECFAYYSERLSGIICVFFMYAYQGFYAMEELAIKAYITVRLMITRENIIILLGTELFIWSIHWRLCNLYIDLTNFLLFEHLVMMLERFCFELRLLPRRINIVRIKLTRRYRGEVWQYDYDGEYFIPEFEFEEVVMDDLMEYVNGGWKRVEPVRSTETYILEYFGVLVMLVLQMADTFGEVMSRLSEKMDRIFTRENFWKLTVITMFCIGYVIFGICYLLVTMICFLMSHFPFRNVRMFITASKYNQEDPNQKKSPKKKYRSEFAEFYDWTLHYGPYRNPPCNEDMMDSDQLDALDKELFLHEEKYKTSSTDYDLIESFKRLSLADVEPPRKFKAKPVPPFTEERWKQIIENFKRKRGW